MCEQKGWKIAFSFLSFFIVDQMCTYSTAKRRVYFHLYLRLPIVLIFFCGNSMHFCLEYKCLTFFFISWRLFTCFQAFCRLNGSVILTTVSVHQEADRLYHIFIIFIICSQIILTFLQEQNTDKFYVFSTLFRMSSYFGQVNPKPNKRKHVDLKD